MQTTNKSIARGPGPESADSGLSLLSSVAQISNAGMAIFSRDGQCLFKNAAIEKLQGQQKAVDLSAFAPADKTSSAFIEFERFRAGKIDNLDLEYQLELPGSPPKWVNVSLGWVPVQAEVGPIIVLTILDIDIGKKAAKEIADNDARWETALEAAGQGMWEFDRATDTLTLSRGWKRMRGVPYDEDVAMDRQSWLSRVHPDDIERINQTSDQQGQGHDGFDILEYRERHRDGHFIWIYSRGRPYAFDDEGKPLRVIGTDTDITQMKTIEAELADQREQLRVTLQSIADGVISTDARGIITFLNPPAENMTGWSSEKAVGVSINKVFRSVEDDDTKNTASLVDRCLAHGEIIHHEGYSKLSQPDGSDLYLRESVAPLRQENGTVTGAVLVFRDATQQRNMQHEMQYMATHDQLTGLPNRAYLDKHLGATIADAKENGNEHALLLIDLDHFKAVNDGAGHAAGDELLTTIGKLIQGACRKKDCVARIGGDEFVVVLDNANLKTARRIAQKIVNSVSGLEFSWHGQVFRVGASVGVSTIDGSVTDQIELQKIADSACYGAKRNGRNCVIVGG